MISTERPSPSPSASSSNVGSIDGAQSQKVSQLWVSGAVPYCTDVIAS